LFGYRHLHGTHERGQVGHGQFHIHTNQHLPDLPATDDPVTRQTYRGDLQKARKYRPDIEIALTAPQLLGGAVFFNSNLSHKPPEMKIEGYLTG
jgi:hypothetical protein